MSCWRWSYAACRSILLWDYLLTRRPCWFVKALFDDSTQESGTRRCHIYGHSGECPWLSLTYYPVCPWLLLYVLDIIISFSPFFATFVGIVHTYNSTGDAVDCSISEYDRCNNLQFTMPLQRRIIKAMKYVAKNEEGLSRTVRGHSG